MRFPGFIGPSYTLRSRAVDCQRCVNLYPEVDELHTGKEGEVAALVSTPGLRLLVTLGDGPIRGLYTSTTGITLVVSGNEVYRLNSGWTGTLLGTIGTSSGAVSMVDNGAQIILVDGPAGYIYTIASQTFERITAEAFPGGDTVTFLDGYFLVNRPDTGECYFSGIYDGFTWDALDFDTAEGSPDRLVAVLANRTQLWLMGSQSAEIWVNSGDATSPFLRAPGAFIQYGCAAAQTFKALENTVVWLGLDQRGQGVVYRAVGIEPQRISTHALEYALQTYGDLSEAVAWTYQAFGHYFYCLSIPGADTTWCFDATTGLWHERTYTNPDTGAQERHRAIAHAFAFSTHIVGDRETGAIYELSETTYDDNGAPIARERITPHIAKEATRIFYHMFQLDLQPGVGLEGLVTNPPPHGEGPPVEATPLTKSGGDPQAMLRWSDDFGQTWSNEHWESMGKLGRYKTRVIWRRMGWSRDRVYWLRITAPVKVVLIGANLQFTVGTS